MNFDFNDEQKLFADYVRRFALAHLERNALARAHNPRFPFDVAQAMSEQGLMGITIAEADGGQGGTLTDAVIAIEQIALICPRSADVVQFGNFGPIRTFAEYGTPAAESTLAAGSARRPHGHEPRHDRTRRGFGRDRSQDHRENGRRGLRHQRHQGFFHLQPGRHDFSGLRPLRPWRLAASVPLLSNAARQDSTSASPRVS